MIPGNLPYRGRMPTATQQREMQKQLNFVNNPVLAQNGQQTVEVSSQGIASRNYQPNRIAARITGHGTGNLYSFEQVLITASSGTVSTLTGGSTGTTTVFPAIELNGRADVPTNAIVDMIPDVGPYGFAFVYDGSGTPNNVCVDVVHVTADLGGSPKTYTVKQVYRDGSGVLTENAGVSYTAYEGQNRDVYIDPGVTQELPLFVDSNSKYFFQIDQYADGSVSPVLAGHVSTADQYFEGPKHFNDEVEVNVQNGDGTGFTDDAVFLVNDSVASEYLIRCWATGGPNGLLPTVVLGDNKSTGAGVNLVAAGTVSYGTDLIGTDGTNSWNISVGYPSATNEITLYSTTSASPAQGTYQATDTKGVATSFIHFLNGGVDYDTAYTIAGSNGSGTGQTVALTFGNSKGDCQDATFVGGIITGYTLRAADVGGGITFAEALKVGLGA